MTSRWWWADIKPDIEGKHANEWHELVNEEIIVYETFKSQEEIDRAEDKPNLRTTIVLNEKRYEKRITTR